MATLTAPLVVDNTDTGDIENANDTSCVKTLKNNPGLHFVFKFAVPAMVNGLCMFLSMWMLHIATYYYVLYMDRLEQDFSYAPRGDQHEFLGPGGGLSPGLTPQNVSYGSLNDVAESFLPWMDVKLSVLDAVAAALPALWGIGTLYNKDLILWTKVMGCNAMLALGKGFIGCITIVPDSIGWTNCKERLKPENIDFLRHSIPNPFEKGQLATYWALLKMEAFGKHGGIIPRGSGMRYCADMMYSGHTYFTCLYALGLLELLKRLTAHRRQYLWCFYLVCVLVVAEQCLEISLVLLNRFHYTSDVFVAILVTLLWYTNAPVVICARWWDSSFNQFQKGATEGYVWIPGLCFPFCGFAGYHELTFRKAREVVSADVLFLQSALEDKVLYHAYISNKRDAHGLVIDHDGRTGMYTVLHVDTQHECEEKTYTKSQLYFAFPDPRIWLWTIRHWDDLNPDVQNKLNKALETVHVELEAGATPLLEQHEVKDISKPKLSEFIKVLGKKSLDDKERQMKKELQHLLEKKYIPGFHAHA